MVSDGLVIKHVASPFQERGKPKLGAGELFVDHGLLLSRSSPFRTPTLPDRGDVKFIACAVTQLFDLVLDPGNNEAVGLGVGDSLGHHSKLVVFQKMPYFGTAGSADTFTLRDDPSFR